MTRSSVLVSNTSHVLRTATRFGNQVLGGLARGSSVELWCWRPENRGLRYGWEVGNWTEECNLHSPKDCPQRGQGQRRTELRSESEELRGTKSNSLHFLDETRLCAETGGTLTTAGHPPSSTASFEGPRKSLIQHAVVAISKSVSIYRARTM